MNNQLKNKELSIIDQRILLGKEFRIYGTKENPLFLAKDVAEWIDYQKISGKNVRNTSKMLNLIDDDEKVKATLDSNNWDTQVSHGGIRANTEMWFLTEDGLYEVLMQSRKPIAKAFKKEVKAILKQIRQTGGYIPVQEGDSEAEILSKALMIAQKKIELKNMELAEKENKILQDEPKVRYYDTVLSSNKSHCVTSIAKELGTTKEEIFNVK